MTDPKYLCCCTSASGSPSSEMDQVTTEMMFIGPFFSCNAACFYKIHSTVLNPFAPQYTLRCDMKRPLLAKDLSRSCEFIVHCQVSETHLVLLCMEKDGYKI